MVLVLGGDAVAGRRSMHATLKCLELDSSPSPSPNLFPSLVLPEAAAMWSQVPTCTTWLDCVRKGGHATDELRSSCASSRRASGDAVAAVRGACRGGTGA